MKTSTFGRLFRNLPALAFGAMLFASAATGWGQTTNTFSAAGSTNWICPVGVTSVTVECWGGGGSGGASINGGGSPNRSGAGGGGGGAYASSSVAVVSGNTYAIVVGAGGPSGSSSTSGGDSSFHTSTVIAKGGAAGSSVNGSGLAGSAGSGGLASASTGNTKFSGGNGAAGTTTSTAYGGGGGSSAGSSVAGNNASTTTAGVAPSGGAAGGAGKTATGAGDGSNASAPGGGGGGALSASSTSRLGGAGGTGQVRLTFTAAATPTITAVTLPSALTNTYGTASPGVSYTATGTNLTGQITNTPVTGFEISTNNSAWSTNATAVNTNTTMWVRTAATRAAGTNNRTTVVTLASLGATSTNVTTSSSSNVVSPASLTITGLTAQSKDWDGTTTASVTGTPAYSGLVNSETFSVTGSVTWAFADANVGTNKPLTRTGTYDAPSANYTVTQPTLTASIIAVAPGAPTITSITPGNQMLSVAFTAPDSNGGASISNYEYSIDGGNNWVTPNPAVISSPLLISGLNNDTAYGVQLRAINSAGSGSPSATTSGTPVAPNSPTITVSSATLSGTLSTTYGAASSSQSFTVSGATLDGNLTVSAPAGLEVSLAATSDYANSLDLTATGGVVPMTTIYVRLQAAAAAGSYNNQNITVSGGGATPKNVSTASSGNAVAQAALTISGISIENKVYDGTTTATITGTASYVGLQNGETFSVGGTPSAVFATNGNVGTGKSVTVSGYTAPSSNYAITQPTGLTANITAKELTIAGAAASNKVFDGTTTAAITGTLAGVVGADAVTLIGTGTFASVNVGAGIAVTSTSTLSGADAANYSLVQPTGLTADITQATQSITFGLLANANVGTTNGLTATASSGLAVSYTSANTNVASISGTNVIANAAGVTTITASQAGNSNVAAATPVSQTLNVVNTANLGTPTSTQNFGTTAATNTSQTASTSTITNPTSGTTYARAGATAPAAPIIVATNTPNPLGTSGAYLRAVASSTASVAKASPITGYTGGKEFYTSFKVLLGDSAGSTNATSGNWTFWQGTGVNYTDNQQVGVSQAAVGLRFTFGSSGAVSLSYAPTSGSTFLTTGLSSTSLTQGTAYNVEVVLFNGASGTKTYSYNGQTKTLSAGNCDIYINGVQFASNLTSGGLTLNTTIDATTFTGVSSTGNAANLFVDDFVVYNAIPSAIGNSPGITPGGTFPALVTTYGTASSNNSLPVSGGGLTSNITATPPTGFEVSTNGNTWSSNATFTQTSGFADGTLYLRLASNAFAGTYSIQSVSLVAGSVSNRIAISNSTVNRYPVTVGAVATNKVYGTADPVLTYTNAPLLFSDTFSGSITRAAGTNAGTYSITQGTLTNANYGITFLTNDFTITPAALTITANNVIKPAGIALTTPQTGSTAFTSGGLVSGDSISSLTITYTDGASSEAPAGLYRGVVVPSAPLGINTNNYNITFNAGDLTVDATPTITVGTASLSAFSTTYGTDSSAQNFTVLGGSLPGSTLSLSAPAGFQVSTNATSGFGSSLMLDVVSGAVPITTIYARIPGATGASTNLSGDITVSSDSATTRSITIPASTVATKALTIGGLSATNRVYDATTNGTVAGTPVFVGLTNNQSFDVTNNVNWSFANKSVGTNKALTASTNYTAPSTDYTISAQPTFSANITQATLTLSGAAATSRAYAAGNTNVTITGTLSGVFAGDTVGFTGAGTVASANVGTAIPVTANVTLTGADSGNYTLTQPIGLTVDITKASQTITFGALSNVTVGTTNALTATASSGLVVAYASSNTNVATISGSNVIAVAAGVTTITASQAGDDNVEGAPPVSRTLNVSAGGGSTTLLSENFNAMSTNNTLPAGFRIQASTTNAAWSNGGNTVTQVGTSNNMTAGGTYNFGATTNERSVGAMTSGGFASPNNLMAVVTNTSGSTVSAFSVSYVAERFRVNTAVASVQLFASTNGSNWTALTNGDVPSSNFPTGTSSYTWTNPTTVARSNVAVTNFSVANSGLLYLRWNIDTTGGNSQAVGIDDVQVTTSGGAGAPAIAPSGSFLAVSTTYGTASAASASTAIVTGGSLTSNITAIPPAGFEVSTDGTTWSNNATFTQNGGFADGTLYLRLAAAAAVGTYSNQVVSLSSGAASNSVAIASSTVSPKALAIAGAAVTTKTYDGTNSAAITGTLEGVVGSDDVNLVGTGTFDSSGVGTAIPVTSTGTLSGTAAGNYTLTQPQGLSGAITAKPVSGSFTASSKTYNGDDAATVTGRSLTGVVGSDDVSLTGGTATFDDANAGTGKTVTLTGATLSGAAAGNYTLDSVSTTSANIDKATPSITAAPTASAIAAGQALSVSILTGGNAGNVPGTFAWTDSSIIPPVGTTSYGVTFTPTDATNYNTVATSVNVTVSQSGYDSWASTNGLTGADASKTADPDGDGFINASEYAFGTNPRVPNGSLLTTSSSNSVFRSSWAGPASGVTYGVQSATNLSTTGFTNDPAVTIETNNGVMSFTNQATGNKFFRVRATSN